MPVEVAAVRGQRWASDPDPEVGEVGTDEETGVPAPGAAAPGAAASDYHDARTVVVLGPGESADVEIRCDFEPDRFEVDPDALVLQLGRENALARL
jgi:hypothetical protein